MWLCLPDIVDWSLNIDFPKVSLTLLLLFDVQLKAGQQIPSPSELMGKILIKNKKGSHGKPAQTKKNTTATDQTTAAAVPPQDSSTPPQDASNPAATTQENQGTRIKQIRLRSKNTDALRYF